MRQKDRKNMKRELIIPFHRERATVAGILANCGYVVRVEERPRYDEWNTLDYILIVEDKDGDPEC